mmetsp:Transcript_90672/g.256028  ORF Transcript_90672/g.256028 Transcript_90672/m.256028 type:complete len:213 (-) Transcript_90672:507-1145(-)
MPWWWRFCLGGRLHGHHDVRWHWCCHPGAATRQRARSLRREQLYRPGRLGPGRYLHARWGQCHGHPRRLRQRRALQAFAPRRANVRAPVEVFQGVRGRGRPAGGPTSDVVQGFRRHARRLDAPRGVAAALTPQKKPHRHAFDAPQATRGRHNARSQQLGWRRQVDRACGGDALGSQHASSGRHSRNRGAATRRVQATAPWHRALRHRRRAFT